VRCSVARLHVRVESELPIAAERAWELMSNPAMLNFVMPPVMGLSGLPERWSGAGGVDRLELRAFGRIPLWEHVIRFERFEPNQIVTDESGGPVKVWRHAARVEPLDRSRCRYVDDIEVDAGWATPLVWAYAQYQYRHRQRQWRALARVLAST
jgi:hypothetical protein